MYGQPYNKFFAFEDKGIYCSELPYLAYKEAGISIGTLQKIGELHVDNMAVRKLIEQRWRDYPACKTQQMDFDECRRHVLDQELVTPRSIAKDPQLKEIYSNYPFY
jgi:hypothetical protein